MAHCKRITAQTTAALLVLLTPLLFAAPATLPPGPYSGPTLSGPIPPPASEPTAPIDDEILFDLVAPVALYPDDLLALILPAATTPMHIVQAARYLEVLDRNPALTPAEHWSAAIVALLNYPEALQQLDQDIGWTERLGAAVLAQEADVIRAVAAFREAVLRSGNLKSDGYQIVDYYNGVIRIRSTDPRNLYVPRYEPTLALVQQSAPVIAYSQFAYPLYYDPYPVYRSHFWGVSSAFAIGWAGHALHVYGYDHARHPFRGHAYDERYRHHRAAPHSDHQADWNRGNSHGDQRRSQNRQSANGGRVAATTARSSNRANRPAASAERGARPNAGRSAPVARDNTRNGGTTTASVRPPNRDAGIISSMPTTTVRAAQNARERRNNQPATRATLPPAATFARHGVAAVGANSRTTAAAPASTQSTTIRPSRNASSAAQTDENSLQARPQRPQQAAAPNSLRPQKAPTGPQLKATSRAQSIRSEVQNPRRNADARAPQKATLAPRAAPNRGQEANPARALRQPRLPLAREPAARQAVRPAQPAASRSRPPPSIRTAQERQARQSIRAAPQTARAPREQERRRR